MPWKKQHGEPAASPPWLPALPGGPLLVPAPQRGWVDGALANTAALLGTVGTSLLWVRRSLWRCVGLSVGQVLLNP